MGPHTYAPISWFCKKQGPVSHSSSESEVISLDAALRMEGLPALMLWDVILSVLGNKTAPKQKLPRMPISQVMHDLSYFIDYVPCNIPFTTGLGKMFIMEDNDAVIKMTIKGRSPNLRHVPRTHRVDLDWLFERIRNDPGVFIKFISTIKQVADILTKGAFSANQWDRLCRLAAVV